MGAPSGSSDSKKVIRDEGRATRLPDDVQQYRAEGDACQTLIHLNGLLFSHSGNEVNDYPEMFLIRFRGFEGLTGALRK